MDCTQYRLVRVDLAIDLDGVETKDN